MQTSNGLFKTTYVGNLELMFPELSTTKISSVCLDMVIVGNSDEEYLFDLITVLDFQGKTI